MTQFIKDNFYGTEYVDYNIDGKSKFVARFKYSVQRRGKGSFITFLVKNFTVEEYFGRLDSGEAPLTILQSKGYILPHIKKWLKEGGYPVTQAGYAQFMKVQSAISDARMAKAA